MGAVHDVSLGRHRDRQRREAEAFEPNPIIAINVKDPNGLAGPGLARAEELASKIYRQAGVTLQWTVDETKADTTLMMIITTSVTAPRGLTSDAMGVAPSPGDGTRGTTAYIFLDKVAFASSDRIAATYVLACALAHEIGHLLLPVNAHRRDARRLAPGTLSAPNARSRRIPPGAGETAPASRAAS